MAEEAVAEKPIKLKVATQEDFSRAARSAAKKAEAPIVEPTHAAVIKEPEIPIKPAIENKAEDKKPEDKIEGEKPARKKIKEVSKPFFEKKESPVEAKDEIPEPLKLKISEYEQRLGKPTYKIIDEAEKAGKTVFDLFEEFRTEDVSKLSDTQLYERELLKSGTKPASEIKADSDEVSLEEEMQKFKELPKLAQKREADEIRKQYSGDKDAKINNFLSKLTSENDKKNQASQAAKQAEEQVSLKAVDEYNKLCDAYIGKEHYSVVGTPQMAESLKNILEDPINGLIGRNQDGSLNAENLFDLAHYKLFKDLRQENLENQLFSNGYEALEQIVAAKGAEQKIVRAPQATATNVFTELKPVDVGHPSVHV